MATIEYPITLSTTEPNNHVGVIKVRQSDEDTQTLIVQITENGQPKSFEGLKPFWCAKIGQSNGLGIIERPVDVYNQKNGTLEYTLYPEDWQHLGRQTAYFSFQKMVDEHNFVEQFSTRDFNYEVIPSVFSRGIQEIKRDGSTYIWKFEDLLRLMEEFFASGQTDFWEWFETIKDTLGEDAAGELAIKIVEIFGNLGELKNFRKWDESIIEKMANEFTERGVNVKWFGAIGDGINDDTEAIQAASKNSTLTHIPRLSEYSINQTVSLSSSINSDFATLKAKTKGLEKIASYEDQDVVEIGNLKFDLNEIARGGLHFKNCKKVIIKNCEFTGYSADYGYYKTDSCLLIQDCIDVTIDNCHFHDTGFKYGEELETLNRCITLQTSVNFYEEMDVSISGCKFNKANQGIITGSTKINLKISDCTFKETKDNSVYLIPVGYCQISNCYFDDRFDEAIVCMGNDILITNTIFKNAPNKSIAIAGDVKTLAISNCTFDFNDVYTNNILSYRSTAYKISRLSFNSNILSLKIRENDTTDVFELGNIDLFSFCDNQIFVKEGGFAENKRLLSFRGGNIQSGIIKNNIFTGENIAEKAYFANGSGMSNIVFENNVNNCRIPMGVSSKFTELKSNINAIVGLDNRKIMTADSAPGTGSWKVGDIILTKNPSLSTPSRKHFGWVCVEEGSPGKWKIFGSWE